jgi:hypothetical protein
MALLAETLVEEWLSRQGYFTIRGVKEGVREIDLLAVKPGKNGTVTDGLHVEVQISFRPVAYVTKLTQRLQQELKKAPNSAYHRTDAMLRECVIEWVDKKFRDPRKVHRREALWSGLQWHEVLVHGAVMEPKELRIIRAAGIRLIPLETVLDDLSSGGQSEYTSAGGDLAELIAFYASKGSARARQRPRH